MEFKLRDYFFKINNKVIELSREMMPLLTKKLTD